MAELETPNPASDPLASLHKMSTTAGVSTQEYVALNGFAVAAIVLGLAASLAFIAMPFMLLAAGGVVCGLFAIRQVRNSNGTQKGVSLAVIGILLSVLMAGGVLALEKLQDAALDPSRQAIEQTIAEIGRNVQAGDYKAAYALFDPDFQQEFAYAQFEPTWHGLQQENAAGKLVRMEGNHYFGFYTIDGRAAANTMAIVRFAKSREDGRVGMVFRQQPDGRWRCLQLPEFFPEKKKRR